MPEHEFSATCIFSYKHRKSDSDLARENTGDRKPEFWHILRNVIGTDFYFPTEISGQVFKFSRKSFDGCCSYHKSAGTQRSEEVP